MMARLFALCLSLAVLSCEAALDPQQNPVGPLHVLQPNGPARGVVILYSAATGWDERAQQAAAALAHEGALVAGIDLRHYAQVNRRLARKCFYLVGDAEAIARDLQRARADAEYHAPILAGVGAGGTLAELVIREAPPSALDGAVSIDPIVPKDAPCAVGSMHPQAGGKLPGFWTVGLHASSNRFVQQAPAGGSLIDTRRLGSDVEPFAALAALVRTHLDSGRAPSGVAKLPLIELPSARPAPLLAILLSGDGGWRDLDKSIAEELSRNGVSVVGWDCLRYFWSRKSPEEAARDLAAVIQTYTARWQASEVALIGYSFGADVLPLLYQRLPQSERSRVVQLSFLGLSSAAEFEIKVAGWVSSHHSDDAEPTQPALATIPPALVQCFFGDDEQDSACPALAARGAETIGTAGGHHFDGNYARLAQRILDGFRKRAGTMLRRG